MGGVVDGSAGWMVRGDGGVDGIAGGGWGLAAMAGAGRARACVWHWLSADMERDGKHRLENAASWTRMVIAGYRGGTSEIMKEMIARGELGR